MIDYKWRVQKALLVSLYYKSMLNHIEKSTLPLGTDGTTKTDEFSEKFQTAFEKLYCRFRDKSAYVHYGGTVIT